MAEEIKGSAHAEPVLGAKEQASDMANMREHFAKQKKVPVRILKDKGDAFVQVNGYTFIVQAGVRVEVPEQVRDMLEDAGYI